MRVKEGDKNTRAILCVPTLNPGKLAEKQADAILQQKTHLEAILILDSESDDRSINAYRKCGAKIHTIKRRDFNHGATRQLVFALAPDAEFIIFLTQDAIPRNEFAIGNMLDAFSNPMVGAAYGRQLPRRDAATIETHARLFNYGPENLIKSQNDIPRLGIKTAFLSNSFAAYRRTALQQVGGFPNDVIFGEDAYVAARMILRGWKIAYQASAEVYHSHDYTIAEEFRRYFDVGVFHASEPWIRERFGDAEGEGGRFVRSELRYLWANAKLQIPSAILRTGLKYFGYRLGAAYQKLPKNLVRACSMNRRYWDRA